MKKLTRRMAMVAAAALVGFANAPAKSETVLNVVTAGSENMVDYVTDYLGPMFEKQNPGVKVKAVGTGPGDAGSQKIFEKLNAQKQAGSEAWDVDVAVVHQKKAGDMVEAGLLGQYRNEIDTGKLVTRDTAKSALEILRWPGLFMIVILGLGLLYKVAPNRPSRRSRWLSVGAFTAASLWVAVTLGFSFYVTNLGSFNATYGALSGVIVLLLWFFISGFVILLGAEVNAVLEHRRLRARRAG